MSAGNAQGLSAHSAGTSSIAAKRLRTAHYAARSDVTAQAAPNSSRRRAQTAHCSVPRCAASVPSPGRRALREESQHGCRMRTGHSRTSPMAVLRTVMVWREWQQAGLVQGVATRSRYGAR